MYYDRGGVRPLHHEEFPLSTSPQQESSWLDDRIEDNSFLYRGIMESNRSKPLAYEPLFHRHDATPSSSSLLHRNSKDISRPDSSSQQLMMSMRLAGDVEKSATAIAVERAETLLAENKMLSQTVSLQRRELETYRKVTGSNLDGFLSEQAQLREEIVRLREHLRNITNSDSNGKERIKELESLLRRCDQQQNGGGGDANDQRGGELRLAALQDSLAKAYLSRSDLIEELRAAAELRKSLEWRQEAFDAARAMDGSAANDRNADDVPSSSGWDGSSLSHWQARGREVELQSLLAQKDQLIASLTAASRELENTLQDQHISGRHQSQLSSSTGGDKGRGTSMMDACPGCGKSPMTSPFCPQTGHAHARYVASSSSSPDRDQPHDRPVKRKTVDEVCQKGLWKKLVDIDNAILCFEEVGTGRQVSDLEAELDKDYRQALERFDAQRKRELSILPADAKIVHANTMLPIAPGLDKEIRILIDTVKLRNEEIKKLKGLLKRILESGGLAALPAVQYPDAAPHPASQPPLVELPVNGGESMEERLAASELTKQTLNQRCADLLCEAQIKENQLAELKKEVARLRFASDPFMGDTQRQLELELEKAKRDLVLEKRRVLSLHDETKRLRSLLPGT